MRKINKYEFFKNVGYTPHPAQEKVHDSEARFRVVCAGRRFGKSLLASRECMAELIKPGHLVWIVAPTYELTKKVFREVYWAFHRYLPHWIKKSSESELKLWAVNDSRLECKSADNPVSLIGEGINFLCVDECARIPNNVWYAALRPTLTDTEGKCLFISTPQGYNWFRDMFFLGQKPDNNAYESWCFSSYENPYLKKEEIEEAKRTMPERIYRQEFLAEFTSEFGEVFRNIDKCIKGDFEEPKDGENYVIGVDLAKYTDFTVLIVGRMEDTHLHIVKLDRFNQIDWSIQKSRIVSMAKKYNDATVIVDSTGIGDAIYEDLSNSGINVRPFKLSSNTIKNNLIENLAVALEDEEVSFPDIPELINELKTFSYERSETTGRTIYNAPPGFHDDCVIALSLVIKFSKVTPLISNFSAVADRPAPQHNLSIMERLQTYQHTGSFNYTSFLGRG